MMAVADWDLGDNVNGTYWDIVDGDYVSLGNGVDYLQGYIMDYNPTGRKLN